jgi:NAD(P)H-nitrite reductase large subunit
MSNLKTKYLIIGTSAAGLTAALELRKLDPAAQITCLTGESEQPYNKCFLVDYLAGERVLDTVYLYTSEFLAQQKITILYNSLVTEIRPRSQEIQLASGELIAYDKLLIATGARAWTPPIPGIDKLLAQGLASNFYSLQDTLKLQAKLNSNNITHATVIGAGLTGLECADALWRRGSKVSIIDQSSQILNRVLDLESAQFLQQKIINSGTELILGAQVLAVENNSTIKITLSSQAEIYTDLIILATGVQANSIKIMGAELNLINQQIQVDQFFATNLPNIWAAGDAILVRDLVTSEFRPNRTWPDAILQGRFAARGMLAANLNLVPYTGQLAYYKSHLFNLDLVVCGYLNNFNNSNNLQNINENNQTASNLKNNHHVLTPSETGQVVNSVGQTSWATFNYNLTKQLQGFILIGDISQGAKLRRQIGT